MSTLRGGADQRAIKDLPKGPNGRALCRECDTEVPKGRRSFCSDKCVSDYNIKHDPSSARYAVHKRDRGVCSECRLRTDKLYEALRELNDFLCYRSNSTAPNLGRDMQKDFISLQRRILPGGRMSLWDMDHIKPVEQGGGMCGLDNLQTLCLWCHKKKTARQAGEKAAARKAKKK